MSELFIAGVDVGGTKILSGVASEAGELLSRDYRFTQAEAGAGAGVERILASVESACKAAGISLSQLSGIALAIAGLVNMKSGVLAVSPNLPGWVNVPLVSMLRSRTGLEVYIINDATAAALGEKCYGAGRGVDNLVYLTVSTGIGGGIVANGELYCGADGLAGEIGHMIIQADGPECACGSHGCLESLASGTAIAREAISRLKAGASSLLREMAGGDIRSITAKEIESAARQGDRLAQEVIARAAYYLGLGLGNIVNIFDPELIIVGGGVAQMGDLLLAPAIETMHRSAYALQVAQARVVPAQIGDSAGVLGAVAFALQQRGRGLPQ